MRNLYLRNFRRCQRNRFDALRLSHDAWSIIFGASFMLMLLLLR